MDFAEKYSLTLPILFEHVKLSMLLTHAIALATGVPFTRSFKEQKVVMLGMYLYFIS